MQERLIDLESRLMHQEKLYEQLNEVVTEQAALIERLQREINRLKEQILAGPNEDVNEPPPHY
ncbi:MAG: SlyX family protein [Planctomycetota bacterium]|nr:SlyX family protein [Planctomycetota bacterium]